MATSDERERLVGVGTTEEELAAPYRSASPALIA